MSDSENYPDIEVAEPVRRARGSGPILILAVLFVSTCFLAWYFTWFGRRLSDDDISTYLNDVNHPRHVQHALAQIEQGMERGDPTVKKWYPQLVALSSNNEREFRLTVAWIMGFDNQSKEFHEALQRLLRDSEPIVRRNAALALVRFNDNSGRTELVSILTPYAVRSPTDGIVDSTLREGATVARGSLLARIQQSDGRVAEIRSPLPGAIKETAEQNGAHVSTGTVIMTLNPDENSVWEALRGLSLIGGTEDLDVVAAYTSGSQKVSERIKEQAALTARAIQSRARQK